MNTFIAMLAALAVRDMAFEVYAAFRVRRLSNKMLKSLEASKQDRTYPAFTLDELLGENIANTNRTKRI